MTTLSENVRRVGGILKRTSWKRKLVVAMDIFVIVAWVWCVDYTVTRLFGGPAEAQTVTAKMEGNCVNGEAQKPGLR